MWYTTCILCQAIWDLYNHFCHHWYIIFSHFNLLLINHRINVVKLISSLWKFYVHHHGWPLWNICVTNDHRFVSFVIITIQFFSFSWLLTKFVTRITQQVPLVEKELFTLLEHLSSFPVFSGICVTQPLVFCEAFCRSLCVLFLLTIVLSVLWFAAFDYPFGIFKLYLNKLFVFVLMVKTTIGTFVVYFGMFGMQWFWRSWKCEKSM